MVSVSQKRILSLLETVFHISINLYELGIGKSFLYLSAHFNLDWAGHASDWCSCHRFYSFSRTCLLKDSKRETNEVCFLWVKTFDWLGPGRAL